jgi:hypothetical protein
MSIQKASDTQSSIRNNHQINKIKEIHKVDNYYENNDISNFIIRPTKITKEVINIKSMAQKRDDEQELEYNDIKKNKKMINNPYKGIISKDDFDYNKKIDDEDDLIVYKAKEGDKNKKIFNKEYSKFKKTKKKDDKNIEEIYSKSEKAKHKKNFVYNQKYKYSAKVDDKDDDGDCDNLRTDRIEFYKKEQQKAENNKKKVDDIIIGLVESGIISENMDSIDLEQIDENELEKRLKEAIGEENFKKMYENLE